MWNMNFRIFCHSFVAKVVISNTENCTISEKDILYLQDKNKQVKVFLNGNKYQNANSFGQNRIDMTYIQFFVLVREPEHILNLAEPKLIQLMKARTFFFLPMSSPIFCFCLSLILFFCLFILMTFYVFSYCLPLCSCV